MPENFPAKLELHYFFIDESHTMDAVVRNRCEHQILMLSQLIAKELGVEVKIETEPRQEGGLMDIFSYLVSPEGAGIVALGSFVVSTISLALQRIPAKKSKLDKEEQTLRIEQTKGAIALQNAQLKELEYKNVAISKELEYNELAFTPQLQNLKNDIDALKIELIANRMNLPKINIENINIITQHNPQVNKFKSNFYANLKRYYKVTGITAGVVDANQKPISSGTFIPRTEFSKYILETDDLEPITTEATIEIISPVLKNTKFKWKGFINQNPTPIDFTMKSKDFKEQILKEGLVFKSGCFIDCTIEIQRRIDDMGNIINSGYTVLEVSKFHNDGVVTEITKKKRKKKGKDDSARPQMNLFGEVDFPTQ